MTEELVKIRKQLEEAGLKDIEVLPRGAEVHFHANGKIVKVLQSKITEKTAAEILPALQAEASAG